MVIRLPGSVTTCLVHPCTRLAENRKIPTASKMQEKSPDCLCLNHALSFLSFHYRINYHVVSTKYNLFYKRTAYLLRVCVLFATISPEYDKTGFSVSFLVLSYRNAENFILQ